MASTKTPKRKRKSKQYSRQVSFTVEPEAKVQITIESGAVKAGKIPITVHVDQVRGKISARKKKAPPSAGRLRAAFEAFLGRLKDYDLGTWLFISALAVYLLTRLIGLDQYPIYFFTDEAIQTQSMADLIANGYRDGARTLLPTYFKNGEYTNLGLSVYLQWLPLLLFGKSAVVTRAASVLVTLIAAISVGLILRDIFKAKYWWLGTLFLSITPAWFLHSRTAFETAEFTAFYAGTLYAYLLYRYRSPRYLYLTLFLGALAFYTYSPGQMIVPLTALALVFSDWRYHWENRSTALKGLALLAALALPYLRFRMNDPDAAVAHLHTLGSYLLGDAPLSEKISHYFFEYFTGLSAWYWYLPNDRDLARHLMDGYGNIMLATLPFAILGMVQILRGLRQPANRAILIVYLIAPAAGALVQTGITRALVLVIPAAILTAIGLEKILDWIESPFDQLKELEAGSGLTSRRMLLAVFIFLAGIIAASFAGKQIDRSSLIALALILALQVSGAFQWFAKRITRSTHAARWNRWHLSRAVIAWTAFVFLCGVNIHLLSDALRNGPTWSRDYGMGGMQYGAFQIFDALEQYKQEHPETRIVLSPNWANGADVVARFFLKDPLPIEFGSIIGYTVKKFPLDDNTVFVMLPDEYIFASNNSKLKDIRIERIMPYPDGASGFIFARLRYVEDIDEIFAAEKALRQIPQESTVTIDGQEVKVRYSYLDGGAIELVFDNDLYTLARTFEANPFIIEMTFPSPRPLSGFSIVIGSARAQITLKCYPTRGSQPVVYKFEGQGTVQDPELSFDLPESIEVQVLQVEMLDPLSPASAQIHIWELTLR